MDLPKGIFWVMSGGDTSESHVYSLLNICESLYRDVLILTDLDVTFDDDGDGPVTLNEDLNDSYDYCFATDTDDQLSTVMDEVMSLVVPRGWRCWMPSRTDASLSWKDGQDKASNLLKRYRHLDAVCIPNMAVGIGPDRDVIFDDTGPISSVMCPNSGDGFWREIFRASGFYGLHARTVRREMSDDGK